MKAHPGGKGATEQGSSHFTTGVPHSALDGCHVDKGHLVEWGQGVVHSNTVRAICSSGGRVHSSTVVAAAPFLPFTTNNASMQSPSHLVFRNKMYPNLSLPIFRCSRVLY